MKTLRNVILEYEARGPSAYKPPAPPVPEMTDDELSRLRDDLWEVERSNRWLLKVSVSMILVLFVIVLVVVLVNLNQPLVVQVALPVFGISCAGLIRWMIALWREKTSTEMLLEFATHSHASESRALREVINTLADHARYRPMWMRLFVR